ncbi:hypothetical protein HK405_006194 [Cladochytrium tenue]|nr:hypothetical protein HK405_006194 [Cladochytrium tenue]
MHPIFLTPLPSDLPEQKSRRVAGHFWNEREERDRDRATAERRRLAAEDERSLANIRRVRFETSVADWEVARWTQQLDMLQTQLDEWEEEFRLITRLLAP